MSYQESILKRFKKAFPEKTLRTISEETNIQMTRVFRLFNGYEMKLNEYEAFELALRKKSLIHSKFELLRKFEVYLNNAQEEDLVYFEVELDHFIKINQFLNTPFIESAGFPAAL